MSSVLEAADVSVQRGGRTILHNATLRLAQGQCVAVVGPNGSGKSTLLRALAGLWPVSTGSVTLSGKPLAQFSRREIAHLISFVPQDTRIDFGFTVEEIVGMGRYAHRGRFAGESQADRAAVAQALERCDVNHLRGRAANTLSGGERQRVLIARSLAAKPQIILLDEPTASLDIEHALGILALCRTLAQQGQTVVFSIHDLNAAVHYADAVALLDQGCVVHYGPPSAVLTPSVFRQIFGVQADSVTASDGSPQFVFRAL